MQEVKIAFFRTISLLADSTELLALQVLNDPKYDKFPQYIDKEKIQEAFDEYGYKLNPFNSELYSSGMSSPNIEGHFLAENLPEIESVVFDEQCDKNFIREVLNKDSEITHIGLSSYATGIENAIDIINFLKEEFPEKTIYLGGMGALYSQITDLIDDEYICKGNGINWLRNKFALKLMKSSDFKIPLIESNLFGVKTYFMVTQIGCPFNCDFCVTAKFLKYNPTRNSKKIINYLENIRASYNRDVIIYNCDPNAFFPEKTWNEVFDYFIQHKNDYDNYLFLVSLISLAHLKNFNLSKIQNNGAIQFFLINYGIESTTGGNYYKNKGVTNKFIKEINSLGIVSHHNFILGLPHHTEKLIDVEIQRNLKYDSIWYSINTLKPVPTTDIYENLKREKRLFGNDIPPELLYRDGFYPFNHKHLGSGFDALKHAFKAYYECEKKDIDAYSNLADALMKSPMFSTSYLLKSLSRLFLEFSKMNLSLFKERMPNNLVLLYEAQLNRCKKKLNYRK
jgi:hypothetical protein